MHILTYSHMLPIVCYWCAYHGSPACNAEQPFKDDDHLSLSAFAANHITCPQVANVLGSIDNAKRVLREAAILRRLRHPNIVRLHDVFLRPSDTGGRVCLLCLCYTLIVCLHDIGTAPL